MDDEHRTARLSLHPTLSLTTFFNQSEVASTSLVSAINSFERPQNLFRLASQPVHPLLWAGFVFYAPRAGEARRKSRAGGWPFWEVQRSSEFGEPSSLWLSTNDRQSNPIQIENNIGITAIAHHCTGVARRTVHISVWKRAGTAHRTKPACGIAAPAFLFSYLPVNSSI